jgi:Ca2+-binding EF-hand superfamily protein
MYKILLLTAVASTLTSCQTKPPVQPDRFGAADVNKDGVLSRTEVNHYFAAEVFVARDTNHDGKITREEWNPVMNAKDRKKFDAIDANKDGVVTLEEAKAAAEANNTFAAEFKVADSNKDGVISREEAKAFYASKEGPMR